MQCIPWAVGWLQKGTYLTPFSLEVFGVNSCIAKSVYSVNRKILKIPAESLRGDIDSHVTAKFREISLWEVDKIAFGSWDEKPIPIFSLLDRSHPKFPERCHS